MDSKRKIALGWRIEHPKFRINKNVPGRSVGVATTSNLDWQYAISKLNP